MENSKGFAPKDTISLLIALRKSSEEFGSVIKNLRVTEKAIEFDLYVLDLERKEKTIAKLESQFGKKTSERDLEAADQINQPLDKSAVVKQSVELFNDQRYWECHETLEQIWRREPRGAEKDVQQGIILAASALVHYQRNENDVCFGMIPKAFSKLDRWDRQMYYTVDIERLRKNLKEIEESKVIRPFKI